MPDSLRSAYIFSQFCKNKLESLWYDIIWKKGEDTWIIIDRHTTLGQVRCSINLACSRSSTLQRNLQNFLFFPVFHARFSDFNYMCSRVGRRWHFKKHAPQKVANISKTNFAAKIFFLNITHFWAFEFVILLKTAPKK